MRDPNEAYDPAFNQPTQNQELFGEALFEAIQQVRRELSEQDDTPGDLTGGEILKLLAERSPALGTALLAIVQDEKALGDDILTGAYITVKQLDVASSIGDDGS